MKGKKRAPKKRRKAKRLSLEQQHLEWHRRIDVRDRPFRIRNQLHTDGQRFNDDFKKFTTNYGHPNDWAARALGPGGIVGDWPPEVLRYRAKRLRESQPKPKRRIDLWQFFKKLFSKNEED